MADNTLESLDNFSIQDTMDTSGGNQQLLNDLISPETSTSDVDDLHEISEELPNEQKKPPVKEAPKEENPPIVKGEDLISSFLGDEGDEEEEKKVEGKEKKAPEKKESSKAPEEEEEAPSPFAGLTTDLYNLGVFTKDDENEEETSISSPEEFLDKFNSEKKKGAINILNDFIGRLGEDYQQAFEAIFVKGVDPKQYFSAYTEAVDFSSLPLEGDTNESNQIKVIKQALADQGFETEDIEGEVERLKNYGDLESVAVRHQKVLAKKQAKHLQEMTAMAEQEQQQRTAIKNQYINNVQTILQEKLKAKEFDGIPINPQLTNELQDFLLVDKYKTTSGELLTEFDKSILELKRPENHAQKVKVALLLTLLKKDPTLSTIQKTGVSKKSDALFASVARQKQGDKSKSNENPSSWWK